MKRSRSGVSSTTKKRRIATADSGDRIEGRKATVELRDKRYADSRIIQPGVVAAENGAMHCRPGCFSEEA